jgi:hypothetical protein
MTPIRYLLSFLEVVLSSPLVGVAVDLAQLDARLLLLGP